MAILSKAYLEQLREAFGAPQLVFDQENGEAVLPCVRSSYFIKDEVAQFLNALDADYIQVQLVLKPQGHVSMSMSGATADSATGVPSNQIFLSLEVGGGEQGLLSEHDCPPHCNDDGEDNGTG